MKNGADTVDIYLCPKSFLDDMGVAFSKGDEITVTGSKVKQGENEKAVYFNNRFPAAITAFAEQLDAILARSGLSTIAWQPVPEWESRQHEREPGGSIKR